MQFLTFEANGWAVMDVDAALAGANPGDPNYRLWETSLKYAFAYPGDEYVDWASIDFYILPEGQSTQDEIDTALQALAYTMNEIRQVAPNKPVLIMEMGFPDGLETDSEVAAKKVRAGLTELIQKYPEVGAFAMWTSSFGGAFFFDSLIRPNTAQGNAFREIVEANPQEFRSCVYFSDGSKMPFCADTGLVL